MPIWRIPAAKMKLTRERRIDATYEFVIPLSKQAVEVVSVAMELIGTGAPLLFPSVRDFHKPISDNTLSKFYRDAGLRGVHVPHGWRASFSTMMNELAAEDEREDDREIIDMMLAHVRDGVEAAYNRAAYMKRRREISQAWADMLMEGAVAPSTLVVTQRGTSARTLRKRGRDRRLASAPDAAARKASDGRPHRKEPRA
jgi:integrase